MLSVVLVGLFVWLFVRVYWMLDSVFPTATRATYCLGIFEPKLEREILLVCSGTRRVRAGSLPILACETNIIEQV